MEQGKLRQAIDPIFSWSVPRVYGSIPTAFGAPLARTREDFAAADIAFVGIPWSAPRGDSRFGTAIANFDGTNLTPDKFRLNSLKYGGYLPEFDIDLFSRLSLVDAGNVVVSEADTPASLENVRKLIGAIVEAGAIPFTVGGNSGPGSYSVVQGITDITGEPMRVLHFDAHSDCRPIDQDADEPNNPAWGGTWVWRLLHSGFATGGDYFHFGLRGPRNHPDTFKWLADSGVPRENVVTYRELRAARNSNSSSEWIAGFAKKVAGEKGKVWIGIDVDAINLGSNPDWGDEPLGPSVAEVAEMLWRVGKEVGKDRLGGISIMAMPFDAQTLHAICVYLVLYLLSGIVGGEL